MPRLSHRLLTLGVVLTIAGALILSGCAATDGQATEEDLNNKAFTFPSGTVFHPALAGATTLEFTDKARNFALFSAGGTASGGNRFGSCILLVGISLNISIVEIHIYKPGIQTIIANCCG